MIDIDMWVEIWDIYKIKNIIYIYEYIHGIYKHERDISGRFLACFMNEMAFDLGLRGQRVFL